MQPQSFAFLYVYISYSAPQWALLCFYHTLQPHISRINPSLSPISPFPMQWHSPLAQSAIILVSSPSHWNCMRCNCSVWCMNVCQRTAPGRLVDGLGEEHLNIFMDILEKEWKSVSTCRQRGTGSSPTTVTHKPSKPSRGQKITHVCWCRGT